MSDISVLEIGTANQAAVITYEARAVRPALSADWSQETFRALVSNTWTVDGQGEWMLLASASRHRLIGTWLKRRRWNYDQGSFSENVC